MDSFIIAETSPKLFLKETFSPVTSSLTHPSALHLQSAIYQDRYEMKLYIPFPLTYILHLTHVPPGEHIAIFPHHLFCLLNTCPQGK